MTPLPLNELFRIAPGPIPLLLFVRVALAVGIPLLGFTLAGQPVAAVAGGATAMFVTLCDVGSTRRGRVGMMLLALLSQVRCCFGAARSPECRVDTGFLLLLWLGDAT
jgi:hypothetical protein